MALERERKFKFEKGLTWLALEEYINETFGESEILQQGYLMLIGDRQLRIRIIDKARAHICYKQSLNNTDKIEIENPVSLNEAEELYSTAPYSLTKQRWKTTFQGNSVDIDLYESGLCVVEIEYKDELKELPEYCGEEITGVKEFSNIALAIAETEKRINPIIEYTSTEDKNIIKVTVTQSDGRENSFKVLTVSEDEYLK